MDTAPSQTGDDGVDIDGLVCRMVGVFERLADRARFQQIDVNIVRPGFPRPVAEAMQSPQKVTDLQKWLVVCHQFKNNADTFTTGLCPLPRALHSRTPSRPWPLRGCRKP